MLRSAGLGVPAAQGERRVQTARPRDVGALVLVVGVFLVLLIITIAIGSPVR
jgi:hypothetical protein